MKAQKKILVMAGTLVGVAVLGAFTTVRTANAGDGDAERCSGQKLPLCRDVKVCSGGTCTTDHYYFPGGVE